MIHKTVRKVDRSSVKEEGAARPEKKRISFGRVLLILILLVLNSGLWAYFFYRVRVICDERDYEQRAVQQHLFERLHPKKKEVVLDAVAFVDGEPITLSQVREMVDEMPQLAEMPFETVYPNLLEMLINNRVIMQGAQKAGVLDRPEIKTQLRIAKEQIVGQTYLDELLLAHVTEAELRALYEQELKEFRREEEIHARHILVKTEKEARDIIVQLKAGADFAELANQKSLDENTEGGDLGYFTKAMMIPEFGDAVFDMKKGQLSGPIKTAFGWHVVLVEDKRLANPPAFEDVKEDIQKLVMETKLPAVLEEERMKMNVQVIRPALAPAVPPAEAEPEPQSVEQ